MILIVGLGNPGRRYKDTRHNLGFQIIDTFRKENNFPKFKLSKKLEAEISEDLLDKKKIILAKPQTFMNSSGQAVKKLISTVSKSCDRRILTQNLWVIHDDIDLPLGTIKIAKGRGSAGHKGAQSIIDCLGTKDFVRFRIGIAPSFRPQNLEKFVLQEFTKTENKVIKESIKKAVQAIELTLAEGIGKAMTM